MGIAYFFKKAVYRIEENDTVTNFTRTQRGQIEK